MKLTAVKKTDCVFAYGILLSKFNHRLVDICQRRVVVKANQRDDIFVLTAPILCIPLKWVSIHDKHFGKFVLFAASLLLVKIHNHTDSRACCMRLPFFIGNIKKEAPQIIPTVLRTHDQLLFKVGLRRYRRPSLNIFYCSAYTARRYFSPRNYSFTVGVRLVYIYCYDGPDSFTCRIKRCYMLASNEFRCNTGVGQNTSLYS